MDQECMNLRIARNQLHNRTLNGTKNIKIRFFFLLMFEKNPKIQKKKRRKIFMRLITSGIGSLYRL